MYYKKLKVLKLEQIDEKVDAILNRLKNAFVKFTKEEGVEIVSVVIDDIRKKA